ncbi:probable transcription factor At1g61730 [Eutrema salsugineum]|uniref:probable transcription factor At1g61730 n=1 Tax=Eutrema salsugineum TaxID=72664 RepID=UPI000CED6B53|nr:probable transcription factor At1g61730 [Eutrema salsugineum]
MILSSSEEAEPEAKAVKPTPSTSGTKPLSKESADVSFKRAKKEEKRHYFSRVWSEEDELALLRGIIDFKTKTGKSPFEDRQGFYKSSKNLVSFEANLNQFMDKIRHLRKKYLKKVAKGLVPPFSKDNNEEEHFKLSKAIWGGEEMALKSPDDVKAMKSERILGDR